MQRLLGIFLSALGILSFLPNQAPAACPPSARTVKVEPGVAGIAIVKSTLLAGFSDHQLVGATAPSHGTLEDLGDHYLYRPLSSFWTAGLDSFEILVSTNRLASDPRAETVLLVPAGLTTGTLAEEGFENGVGIWDRYGATQHLEVFSGSGVITGAYSLRLYVPEGDGGRHAWLEGRLEDNGGGQQGSTTQITIRPPRGSGPPSGLAPGQVALLNLGGGLPSSYELWLRDDGDGVVSLLLKSATGQTPWVPVSRRPHRIKVSQWISEEEEPSLTAETRRAGAMLWVDGVLAATLTSLNQQPDAARFLHSGILATAGETSLVLEVDDLSLSSFRFNNPASRCRLGDGFEDGQPDAEWDWAAGGSVNLTTEAALQGRGGLDAVLGTSFSGSALVAPMPADDPRLGFRFGLDPNSVAIANDGKLLLFTGLIPLTGKRPFAVHLEQQGSQYFLRLQADPRAGLPRFSEPVPIPDGPVTLTLDWRRSPSERVPLGTLRLWVDGKPGTELTELDTFGQDVAEIHLGALSVRETALGHIHLDSFVAVRTPHF